MSAFLSNFVSYVTATMVAAACLLVSNGAPQASRNANSPFTPVVAGQGLIAGVPASTNRDAIVLALSEGEAPKGEAFEHARLIAVTFTNGQDIGARPAPQPPTRLEGRVTARSVNLRGGPGTNFAIAGRAAESDMLEVTGKRDGSWIEVISADLGQRVWVHGKYFELPDTFGSLAQN